MDSKYFIGYSKISTNYTFNINVKNYFTSLCNT